MILFVVLFVFVFTHTIPGAEKSAAGFTLIMICLVVILIGVFNMVAWKTVRGERNLLYISNYANVVFSLCGKLVDKYVVRNGLP